MKRNFLILIIVTVLLFTVGVTVGCEDAGGKGAPVLSSDSTTLSWNAIDGAEAYFVNVEMSRTNSYQFSTTATTYLPSLSAGTYTFKVQAKVNGKLSDYSNPLTILVSKDGAITVYNGANTSCEVIFHTGTGAAEDPICINNRADLEAITTGTKTVTDSSGTSTDAVLYYKQTADIDLSGKDWTPLSGSKAFKGVYDGNGRAIRNMKISVMPSSYKVGLFASTSGAVIKNLRIEKASVNINYSSADCNVALLAASAADSTVTNCSAEGVINMPANLASTYSCFSGLLIATSNGCTISRCKTSGSIDVRYCRAYAGGLVGYTKSSTNDTISNCYSTADVSTYGTGKSSSGSVTAIAYSGALVGYASYCKGIENCYATGTVTMGGISGTSTSSLGKGFIGGSNGSSTRSSIKLTGCYFKREGVVTDYDKEAYVTPLAIATRYGIGNRTALATNSTLYAVETDALINKDTFAGWNFNEIWTMTSDKGPELIGYAA